MKWIAIAGWSSYDSGGIETHEIEADSPEDAVRLACEAMGADASDAYVFPHSTAIPLDEAFAAHVERLRREKEAAEAKARQAKQEAKDRAEYERLRAKFGDGLGR